LKKKKTRPQHDECLSHTLPKKHRNASRRGGMVTVSCLDEPQMMKQGKKTQGVDFSPPAAAAAAPCRKSQLFVPAFRDFAPFLSSKKK
jgi:hypothetical protein